jgi:putative PIN family toxin of toxin-antitoxin system
MKAVLDNNVLVSGNFWNGPPSEILNAWQKRRFDLTVSPPILEEYRRVLAEMTKKHGIPAVRPVLEIIELRAEMVEPALLAKPICSDLDDDKFVEAAVAASADYAVSGDAVLLRLKSYRGVEIVRPARFLELISL